MRKDGDGSRFLRRGGEKSSAHAHIHAHTSTRYVARPKGQMRPLNRSLDCASGLASNLCLTTQPVQRRSAPVCNVQRLEWPPSAHCGLARIVPG